jgi:hypothetical protein
MKITMTHLENLYAKVSRLLPASQRSMAKAGMVVLGVVLASNGAVAANSQKATTELLLPLATVPKPANPNMPGSVVLYRTALSQESHEVANLPNAPAGAISHAVYDDGLSAGADVTKKPARAVPANAEIVTANAPGSPVPEPTTWAMLIVGLGVVTLRIRGMGDRSSKIH